MSPLSASMAVTAAPTFVPAALFSGTVRVGVVSEKTGALLVEIGTAVPETRRNKA